MVVVVGQSVRERIGCVRVPQKFVAVASNLEGSRRWEGSCRGTQADTERIAFVVVVVAFVVEGIVVVVAYAGAAEEVVACVVVGIVVADVDEEAMEVLVVIVVDVETVAIVHG